MLAAAGSLGAVGCGDGDGTPEFTGSDEEQVAATVRTVVDAMDAGDGEAACPLLSDAGQDLLVRIINRDRAVRETAASCEDAVAFVGESRFDPGVVRRDARHAWINEEDPDYAEMDCRKTGAFLLVHTGDGWRVNAPYCVN